MKRALVAMTKRHPRLRTKLGCFAAGLRKHGWRVDLRDRYRIREGPVYDLIVHWGMGDAQMVLDDARRSTAQICTLEMGFIGNRLDWSMVGFGPHLNGRANFPNLSDPVRLKTFHPDALQPFGYDPDGWTLVIGQVPTDYACAPFVRVLDWCSRACRQLESLGLRPRFRPHPRGYPDKAEKHASAGLTPFLSGDRPLAEDLAGARAVVTFNSNTGVDAALAGKPVVAVDRGSMAWPVSAMDVATAYRPDDLVRQEWAERLAWKQWREDEMENGYCWEAVCPQNLR